MNAPPQVEDDAATAALDRLRGAVDELLDLPLGRLDRDQLLALTTGIETQARRVPALWHRLIPELDERAVAADLAMRDTTNLLARLLRLDPGEARGRVNAATELGPRRTVTGQPLEALFPAVATAQATGAISARHARVITTGLDKLPSWITPEQVATLETTLTAAACEHEPRVIAQQIQLMLDRLDPDGPEPDDREHQRQRGLTLTTRGDGSGELSGHLTPEAAAVWTTILDALSAPVPAEGSGGPPADAGVAGGGTPDQRSPAQRRHDGLLDAGLRLLRSGSLPDTGGTPVTVLVRLTADDLQAGRGYATTEHGDLIAVRDVIHAAGDGAVIPVLLDPTGGIISYGRTRRLACPAQRRALAARDGGCSFPGCTVPPSWCQVHHEPAWNHGGETDINQMTLLCGYHHREFERRGWHCHMSDGVPHWRPPRWVDPHQKLQRNTAHHNEHWFNPADPPPDPPPPDEPPRAVPEPEPPPSG